MLPGNITQTMESLKYLAMFKGTFNNGRGIGFELYNVNSYTLPEALQWNKKLVLLSKMACINVSSNLKISQRVCIPTVPPTQIKLPFNII